MKKLLLIFIFILTTSVLSYSQLQWLLKPMISVQKEYNGVVAVIDNTFHIFEGDSSGICTTFYYETKNTKKEQQKVFKGRNKIETSILDNKGKQIFLQVEIVELPDHRYVFLKNSVIKNKNDKGDN